MTTFERSPPGKLCDFSSPATKKEKKEESGMLTDAIRLLNLYHSRSILDHL